MHDAHQNRVIEFQRRIADEDIDLAVIHDSDNIYYLSGFWGYLGMNFGRPTILVVPRSGAPILITPGMEAEMAAKMTGLDNIREWTDGVGSEWRSHLDELFGAAKNMQIGLEPEKTHPSILSYLKNRVAGSAARDVTAILAEMRMIKSSEDLDEMRQAGQVAVAMCDAAAGTIADQPPQRREQDVGRGLHREEERRVAHRSAELVEHELLESGKAKSVIDRCYPLGEVAEPLRYYGDGRSRGKVVISVEHNSQ